MGESPKANRPWRASPRAGLIAYMYYVYVLFSEKDNKTYVGYSNNLKRRINEHNDGLVEATKNRRPLKLLNFGCFINESDAKNEELFLKSGRGRERLKYLLKNTFEELK